MHFPRKVGVTMVNVSQAEPRTSDISSRYWLVKFAPFRTSWIQIVQRGTFTLRGVRSPAARKHLSEMRLGDLAFFYHSQQDLAVVGVMKVAREAYPDPTSADPRWLTCDFAPVQTLPRPIPLAEIRTHPALAGLPLLRQPRLAVMPVTASEYRAILDLARL
jgi:predicted RNA-binding protein with PUA-like domain